MVDVLSVIGTTKSCDKNRCAIPGVEDAFWATTAARFAPADAPATAVLLRSMWRHLAPTPIIHRKDSQQSCTGAGKGRSGARLDLISPSSRAPSLDLPIIHCENYASCSGAHVGAYRIFGVNGPKHISAAVEVQDGGPPIRRRRRALRNECSHSNIGSDCCLPLDTKIIYLPNWQRFASPCNYRTGRSRDGQRQVLNLREIDKVPLVEFDIFWIKSVPNRFV